MENSPKKVTKKGTLAIVSAAILSFVGILIETSMNVTFPTMIKEFHVSLGTVQWITTAYLLMVALVIVCSAYVKARFSERNTLFAAVFFFIAGTIISGLAPSFTVLLIGRLVQAGGTGLAIPLMFNIIIEVVPISKRGAYMGIGGLILSLAPAFGPTFGGIVVYYLTWRDIFWIVLPIIILGLVLGMFSVPNNKITDHPKFDWFRLFLLAIMFVSLTLGFDTVSGQGWLNLSFLIYLIIFALATIAFYFASKHSKRMLINITVFSQPVFTLNLIAYTIIQFANIGASFLLPNYAQLVNHSTALIGGLVLLPGSLLASAFSPYFGQLLDKHGARGPIFIGNTIFTIGLIRFVAFALHLTPMMIAILYGVFGFGRSMAFANTMTDTLNNIAPEYSADANALFNTFQQYGGSIGTSVMSSFMTSGTGTTMASKTANGTLHAFIFLLILALFNFVLYHRSFKIQVQQKQASTN